MLKKLFTKVIIHTMSKDQKSYTVSLLSIKTWVWEPGPCVCTSTNRHCQEPSFSISAWAIPRALEPFRWNITRVRRLPSYNSAKFRTLRQQKNIIQTSAWPLFLIHLSSSPAQSSSPVFSKQLQLVLFQKFDASLLPSQDCEQLLCQSILWTCPPPPLGGFIPNVTSLRPRLVL